MPQDPTSLLPYPDNTDRRSPPPRRPRRLLLVSGSGLALGLLSAILAPGQSGCIYPDTCIRVNHPGHDWCRNLTNALQWPVDGSIEDAVPITYANGAVPQGCRCFNNAEDQILDDEIPACEFAELLAEIELAARQECQSLVQPGFEHNCFQTDEPNASTPENAFDRIEPGRASGAASLVDHHRVARVRNSTLTSAQPVMAAARAA